jgi:hypothetical protein
MNSQAVALAISAAFILSGAAVSFVVLWRASVLVRSAAAPAASGPDPSVELLRQKLDLFEADLRDVRQLRLAPVVPHPPRAGMNLDRRSQALRMHRRGESPAQIAAALNLPLQEVDLLLKVHSIVLRTI